MKFFTLNMIGNLIYANYFNLIMYVNFYKLM